jgi:hypothetical protein
MHIELLTLREKSGSIGGIFLPVIDLSRLNCCVAVSLPSLTRENCIDCGIMGHTYEEDLP